MYFDEGREMMGQDRDGLALQLRLPESLYYIFLASYLPASTVSEDLPQQSTHITFLPFINHRHAGV